MGDESAYLALASGEQLTVLCLLSIMMGMGKGGVPGVSTSAVALNSLLAPDIVGGLEFATALQVPVTFLSDITVVLNYYRHAHWSIVFSLLPFTVVGLGVGIQLLGKVGKDAAKGLVGGILLLILLLNMMMNTLKAREAAVAAKMKKDDGDAKVGVKAGAGASEASALGKSIYFIALVGLLGGFATILTNSMGPILNVFLLTRALEPAQFVGTRSCFFTIVNTAKMGMRIYGGTMSAEMLQLGSKLGLLSIVGVFASKAVVGRLSKATFMRMEYALMTFASVKLLAAGLHLKIPLVN